MVRLMMSGRVGKLGMSKLEIYETNIANKKKRRGFPKSKNISESF
jgi:hypothetical protein